jgi:hypothetical protein
MTKKRTAAEFFDNAEENGLESAAKAGVNGDKASKSIEPGTESNYERMLDLWDQGTLI